MTHQEWPAEAYAIGSYIQRTVADKHLDRFVPEASHHILDIGCGDGGYSLKVLEKIPKGTLLGIDASENMIHLAREKTKKNPRFSLQQLDVLAMDFNEQFDDVVSFWCLQWCHDLKQAFMNIHRALKPGGKGAILLPTGDDPFMTSYQTVKERDLFPSLNQFNPPIHYDYVCQLPRLISTLPFKKATVEVSQQSILLPSLDVFRKFVNGIAFFQGQLSDDERMQINEAMVEVYDEVCQEKYQGKPWFDFSVYWVSIEK